jgi:hypothetical protein
VVEIAARQGIIFSLILALPCRVHTCGKGGLEERRREVNKTKEGDNALTHLVYSIAHDNRK